LLARHLRRPEGFLGRFVAGRLDRRNRGLVDAGIDALALQPASVVADIGFGGGIGLQLLLERPAVERAVGIDISPAMVEMARKRFATEVRQGRLRLESGSLTEMPLPDSTLDGATTFNTVYFVDDLGAALREVARVLRPDGRFVIGIGDPEAMARMSFTAHGFKLRSVTELEAKIAEAGLDLVDHRRVESGRVPGHLLVAS
jgi:ubiquinone/menaquinone biosynthesis C-methylase UbiE